MSFLPALALLASIGDASVANPCERHSAHYGVVVEELRAADVSHLDAARRAARARLVDALAAYGARGDFGRAEPGGPRRPWFVDGEGRRCAVAELLHASGEDALVERVRATRNHAWVVELAGDAPFARWLDANGLGFDEAVRIQTPVTTNGERGPADTVPSPGPTPPPAPDAPPGSAPSAPAGSTGGGEQTSAGSAASLVMATSDEDGWWLWWEYAKLEFLVPNRPSPASGPATGAYVPGALRDAIERARQTELPRVVAATQAPEAVLRGAAATALGAFGARDAVEPLVRLLADPNQDVRHRALLALGATASAKGAAVLLGVARDGRIPGREDKVSPYARSIALVALGIARRAGLQQDVATAIRALVRERSRESDSDSVAVAAMFHHTIAPAPALEELALELARDDSGSPSVRCRAVEALGSTHDAATIAELQTILVGPRMDLRRSAALALGATRDARAQPALETAFELEAEPLTRGLTLIALGRIGGAKSHAFLAKVLREGESGDRRWAALALGVLARATGDPETSKLLAAALEREKHVAGRAAYWLASGLVRDESAVDRLAAELAGASDPRQRMYAATALALVGDARAAAVLRTRLPRESSAMGQVAIAQGLGILGHVEDAPALRAALDRLAEPTLQGIAATALAFHGSLEALGQLAELSHAADGPRLRRAASIEGLGLLLSRGEPLSLSFLSRRTNYTVLADWAQSMFQTTL